MLWSSLCFRKQVMWSKFKTAVFLAFKSILRGNKTVLILTPLVISFAIVNLLFSSSMFAGVIKTLNNQLIDNLFANILIEPKDGHNYILDVPAITQKLTDVQDVSAVAAHYKTMGQFVYDTENNNLHVQKSYYSVIGVDPETEKQVTNIHQALMTGSYLEPNDRDNLLIGVEIAGGNNAVFKKNSLGGVKVGDKIKIFYINGKYREYTVKGIFKTGVEFADSLAYVTDKELEGILGVNNAASEILVKTSVASNEQKVIQDILDQKIFDGKINPWFEFSGLTGTMAHSFDTLNFVIGLVNFIVAGATIFIVIFINVVNKRRQLGILKAIGIDDGVIIFSYIIQTLFYTFLGSLIGLGIVYFILNPYFVKNPLDMGFGMVSMLTKTGIVGEKLALVALASLVAGLIPSYRAVKQSIIRSIWKI